MNTTIEFKLMNLSIRIKDIILSSLFLLLYNNFEYIYHEYNIKSDWLSNIIDRELLFTIICIQK